MSVGLQASADTLVAFSETTEISVGFQNDLNPKVPKMSRYFAHAKQRLWRVRDLGLSDFLSSGSLGQFSFQATVTYSNILNHVHGSSSTNADGWDALEIATICNYAGILISDKGSSSTMSGLLTKQSVLEAKSSGKSVIDYEQVQQMTGGNAYKNGLSSLGALYSKYNPKLIKGKVDSVSSQVDSNQNKLSKYL